MSVLVRTAEGAVVHRFRHLVVALARTDADAGLLRYAAAVVRLGTVKEVRCVHVLADPAVHEHDRTLADLQQEVAAHLADRPADVQVFCDVLRGPLLDRLLAYTAEQETDVVLVGHQRGHSGSRALARRLAMKAPCSVWMVPGGSAATVERILVAVDFSDHAADALTVATAMASLAGHSECLALHVYFNEATVTYEGYDEVLRGKEQEAFDRFIAPIDRKGVSVVPVFEEGANAAHVIGRVAAREAVDLVVMATRGRSRSAAILLGSVTEETMIATQVPLMVVKHFGARLGLLQVLLDRGFRRRGEPRFD